jgi:hypothetical protein
MSTDVEELVRDGMHRLAAATDMPAGLVGRARQRVRRRRLTAVSAIASAAALGAAAAVVMVPGASAPAGSALRAHTAAYVIGRVENSAATLITTNVVLRAETTFSPAFPAITQWSYRGDVRAVQSGVLHVTGVPWAQGQVSWAAGTAVINGKLTYVQADYRHHEWYPTSAFLVLPNACTSRLDLGESDFVSWPAYVRQTLSCGKFHVAGYARVDGKKTIVITGSMTEPNWWAGLPHPAGRGAMHVDAVFYIDPSTYLPQRIVWTNWSYAVGGGLLRGTLRQDFQVLPPTPGNVAQAMVTIPAGFSKVSGYPFGGPMSQLVG